MVELLIGIVSSITGALLVIFGQYVMRISGEKGAPFTGTWEDEIIEPNTGVIKKDRIDLRQRGDNVTGDIARMLPENQSHRRWKLIGKLFGTNFFALFCNCYIY